MPLIVGVWIWLTGYLVNVYLKGVDVYFSERYRVHDSRSKTRRNRKYFQLFLGVLWVLHIGLSAFLLGSLVVYIYP